MGRFYDHIPEKLGWVKVVQYALTGQTPVPPAEVRPSPNAGPGRPTVESEDR